MPDMRTHIANLTKDGDHFNKWPDVPAIVEIIRPDGTPKDCFHLGQAIGGSECLRSVRTEWLPEEIKMDIPFADGYMRLHPVSFVWSKRHAGNAGGSGIPNVQGVFHPTWQADYATFNGLIVELGCAHHFAGTQLGKCWRRSTCTKCGYSFEIDSSG